MRIAQVAPLAEAVPPALYGGTERIVSYLTEELVALGHEVSLFASGDSRSGARLEAMTPRALRLDPLARDGIAPQLLMIERVVQRAAEFDIIHFHLDYLPFPVLRRMRIPHLTTLHGRVDLAEALPLFREYREMPIISISDAQRMPLPEANWVGTVYHGLPVDLLVPQARVGVGDGYLAFLGRISPEKGPEAAIRIAQAAGLPIRIAAKVDKADEAYFNARIRPMLDAPGVDFIGEINEADKPAFLGNAEALLFPIDWPEPFGLVMIEAMACGTPVIAFNRGSVPELLEDGITGFVVADEAAAVAAIGRLHTIDRRRTRQRFLERFSSRHMAANYLALYELHAHVLMPEPLLAEVE